MSRVSWLNSRSGLENFLTLREPQGQGWGRVALASERRATAARRVNKAQGQRGLWLKWRGKGPQAAGGALPRLPCCEKEQRR